MRVGGAGDARPAGQDHHLPVRPRRRPDPDGEGPRPRLEGDVRRLPARLGGAARSAVRGVRPSDGLRRVRRRQAAARRREVVPRVPRHRPPDGFAVRPAGGGDRPRPRHAQERSRARPHPRAGRRALRRLGPLRRGGPRSRDAPRRRLLEHELRGRAQGCRHRPPVRGARGRRRRRAREPRRQAGARHVPRGCAHARRRTGPGRRVRGRAGRRARPGGRGTSAGSSASIAPVRPRRSSGAGPTSSSKTSTS